MKFPLAMTASLAAYVYKNKARPRAEWQATVEPQPDASNPFRIFSPSLTTAAIRQAHPMLKKRFPMVLMLEPLHACNLTCTGCGRIREYESTITERVPLEECFAAVEECGAPMVSICGGEPMMYPQIGQLVAGILERDRFIYLCTNGMFIRKRLHEFKPDRRFFFNVHLDGMEKTHDMCVERDGVFKEAIEGIKAAKAAGFMIATNTTVYTETSMAEVEELFEFLQPLGVDVHQLSPAYGYSAVNEREIFMTRDDIHEKFKDIDRLTKKFPIAHTPAYTDFLQGKKELPCTAWGTPTYNTKGWKGPCYVITDAHYKTFEEFMTHTQWQNYGPGGDPRCEHCMMHSGFEPSAAMGINQTVGDTFKTLSWILR
jgi:hopanoid biosynthesis associated radical SAM protein HpnH